MINNILGIFLLKIIALIGGIYFFFRKVRKIGQQDIINQNNEEVLKRVKENKDIERNINNLTRAEHIKLLQSVAKDDDD